MIEAPLIVLGGLLGSAHCLGMCGGFVLTLSVRGRRTMTELQRQSIYAAGRISTYPVAGATAGFVGLRLPHWLPSATLAQHVPGRRDQRPAPVRTGLRLPRAGDEFRRFVDRSRDDGAFRARDGAGVDSVRRRRRMSEPALAPTDRDACRLVRAGDRGRVDGSRSQPSRRVIAGRRIDRMSAVLRSVIYSKHHGTDYPSRRCALRSRL